MKLDVETPEPSVCGVKIPITLLSLQFLPNLTVALGTCRILWNSRQIPSYGAAIGNVHGGKVVAQTFAKESGVTSLNLWGVLDHYLEF